MTETKYHRINLQKLADRYAALAVEFAEDEELASFYEELAAADAGQWVDIPRRRSWGARLKVQGAYVEGLETYKFTVLEQSISRWSFPAPPEHAAFEELDEFAADYIYDEIVQWYAAGGRTPEESKRTEVVAAGAEQGGRSD